MNFGPVALFSTYILTSSSGKKLEEVTHAQIVSLLYKLITSSRGSDDLSIGFDRDRGKRQQELTNIKNTKGKYHLTIMLKDIFGLAKHQENGAYGLCYR